MGQEITLRTGEGETAAYLAEAERASAGVVVLQEWWGLNDQIKGVADRFAAAGYTALAPDLYQGRVTVEADEANHLMTGLDWVGATDQDVRAAVETLRSKGLKKVAVMGFCMGGALTVIAAVKLADVSAAVCYYGIPPVEQADPAAATVPFQGHFATGDDWCTPAAVDALEAAMTGAGRSPEIHRYEGDHAFFNETSEAYDAALATLSWERMLDFLTRHLA